MVRSAATPRVSNHTRPVACTQHWLGVDRRGASEHEACYDWRMSKPKQPGTKAKKKGFVIGRASFGKISAVEGVRLTPAMKKRAADAEREGLSAEEFRRTIVRSYRKA